MYETGTNVDVEIEDGKRRSERACRSTEKNTKEFVKFGHNDLRRTRNRVLK